MIYILKEKKIKEQKKSKTYIDLKHGNPNLEVDSNVG